MKAKKLVFTAVLVLLALLAAAPAACADTIYPAPGTIEAGSNLDHLFATVEADSSVDVKEGTLPDGIRLEVEPNGEEWNVYLRGVPMLAGSYACILNLGGTSMMCSLNVVPATPIVSSSESVSCYLNDPVLLGVSAYSADGGFLSYQWYYSQFGQSENGSVIGGAADASLGVGTAYVGTSYYYCVVTNTNNGLSVQATSPVIAVTVSENTAQTLTLLNYPQKLLYQVGEPLDTTGLQLAVSYSNGSTELITDGFTCSPTTLDYAGSQTITVSYMGMSCSFDVAVETQTEVITGIGILTLPSKLRYTVGETLNTTGLSIRAYTNLDTYRDINAGFTCTPMTLNYAGEQEIIVSYGDNTCSFSITVDQAEIPVSLSVKQQPNRMTYQRGESLDITGLVLRQISNVGNAQDIYSGFTCSPILLNTVGYQQITVYYGDLQTSFTVTVTDVLPSPTPTAAPTMQPSAVQTPVPGAVTTPIPGAVTTPIPGAVTTPIPTASPLPTTIPTAVPTVTVAPTMHPSSHSYHQSNLGRSLISIIVVTAVMALAILGAYVFVMNQGGFDGAAQKLKELFRRKK